MDMTATEHHSTWILPPMDATATEHFSIWISPLMDLTAIEHYSTWISPLKISCNRLKTLLLQIFKTLVSRRLSRLDADAARLQFFCTLPLSRVVNKE